jgi:hypothetical protein
VSEGDTADTHTLVSYNSNNNDYRGLGN